MMVPNTVRHGRVMRLGLALLGLGSLGRVCGQELLSAGGSVRMFATDSAILDSREVRSDLPCSVLPAKPLLGFDLKFHGGYDVSIPLKELAGLENELVMIFRVTPEGSDPTEFVQRVSVPEIDENTQGEAVLKGNFDLGEGKYHVDWLMRDRAERICSALSGTPRPACPPRPQMALDIAPARCCPADDELFKQEAPVEREPGPVNVKVIVNFAPQDSASATLQPLDTNALCSILRNIAREPRIGKFTLIAYNMQEQRVIYRQEEASQIDFPAFGEALKSLNLGTVDLKRLKPEAWRSGVPGRSHD